MGIHLSKKHGVNPSLEIYAVCGKNTYSVIPYALTIINTLCLVILYKVTIFVHELKLTVEDI